MKLRKILMGLAAVVGFTTAAQAATPVAVWDGFDSLTSGDYTWTKSAGTTVTDGVVTIGSDGGLTIANPTGLVDGGKAAVTFIADIEGFNPSGTQMTIFDIGLGGNRVNISSRPSDNNVYQLWNAANNYGNVGTLSTGKVRIITTYNAGSGTTTYVVGGNTANSGTLKSGNSAIAALGIGCYNGTERVAAGMKVYRLAMFNSKLSEADAKAYQFPSELLADRNATIPANADINWADIPWEEGSEPSATDKVKLTLAGDAKITVAEAAACGKIMVTGEGTLTLDAGDNLSTAEIKSGIPLVITTAKNQTVDAGANDLVYNYTGAAMPTTVLGATCTGNLTFRGESEFKWTATVPTGKTLTVADTCTVNYYGNSSQCIKGTVVIEAGATFVNKTDNDILQYSGSPTVKVYGTLDMTTTRWTVRKNNSIIVYAGGQVIGAGHGTYKAIDFDGTDSLNVMTFQLGEAESGTATVTAGIRDRSVAPTFDIPENMTVALGSAFTAEDKGNHTFVKKGAGTLKILDTLNVQARNTADIQAGILDLSAMTGKSTATQIPGGLTMADAVAIRFPAGFEEDDTFTLCGGTLTASAKVANATVYVGDEQISGATLVYDADNKTVAYTTSAPGSIYISGSDVGLDAIDEAIEEAEGPGYTGDVMLTVDSDTTVTIDRGFAYSGIYIASTGAVALDYACDETETYAKIHLGSVEGALTITTDFALPIAAGSRDLTYNYNGADPITNTVVGITTDGVFTKGGPGTMFVNFGAGRKVATIVNEGTLAYTAQNALGNGAPITVNADGTLDFNGYPNGGDNTTITLNGGTLTNSRDIGGGGTGQMQIKSLTLTDNSTINTPYEFGMVGSYWGATTIDLDEFTLTKLGEGTFHVANATISGTGTICVEEGTLDFFNTASTFADGTLELAGGTLNRGADLTAGAVTVTANSAITGEKALTAPVYVTGGATLDCTGLALPLNGVSLVVDETHVGSLKITTTPEKATKVAVADTEEAVEGLTLVDENDEPLNPYCTCGGYFWYGEENEFYELEQDDLDAIEALPAGGVFVKPTLCAGLSEIEGVPEGFYAWIEEDSVVCVAKKTDSISIKFTPASETEGMIATTDASVGGYPVAGKFWNHSQVSTKTGTGTEGVSEIFALKDGNGEELEGVLCYYYMPNMYDVNKRNKNGRNKQTTGNGKLTYSYFDDSNIDPAGLAWPYKVATYGERDYYLPATPTKEGVTANLRWEVAITNIPYQVFDLYIYQASDQTDPIKLMSIAVKANDGAWHYFAGDNAGSTVAATYDTTWNGAAYCDETEMTEGTNYIRYRLSKAALGLGEEDEISVIYLSHPKCHDSARLGLAGVQLVKVENDGYHTRDPEASSNDWLAEDSWLNSSGNTTTWQNPEGSDVAYATIDADSVDTINIDGEVVANEVKLVNAAPGEGEPEKTFSFTTSNGGTLTAPIDATEFHGKLIIPDEGLTSAISLGEHSYVAIEVPEGSEVAVADIKLPEGVTIASGSFKIVGAGTVVCDGVFPTAYAAKFQDADAWHGTVWFKNVAVGGQVFNDYGNANSKLRFTGVRGWFNYNTYETTLPIELVDGDDVLALEVTDGSLNRKYVFAKVTGEGSINVSSVHTHAFIVQIKDVSEYYGKITSLPSTTPGGDETKAFPILIGETTGALPYGTTSKITVADGATINADCGWEAESVAFGATLVLNSGAESGMIVSGLTMEEPVYLATKVMYPEDQKFSCLGYEDGGIWIRKALAFTVTPLDVEGATFAVQGAFAEGESYYAAKDAPVKVTYTAPAGYTFVSSGSNTLVKEGTASEGAVFEAGETPVAPDVPFVYTIAEGEEGTWTLGENIVDEAFVDANPARAIVKEGTGTLEKALTNNRVYDVNGGTLKATNTNGKAIVTVASGATFDINGCKSSEHTVVLKGGAYVNNGNAIGNTQKQIKQLTVAEADSTVGGSADFGVIAGGYAANTLDLGGQKLTKTGAATFWLASTTVTNGTFEVEEGTLQVAGDNDTRVTVFAAESSLVLGEGTTLAVARPLTIGAITADGATINNAKSITPFTLAGTATLTGNGTWGTNTLDGATVNVGNLRGLPFLGTGTVNVQLTAAEESQYEPIVVFTSESEDVVIADVYDHDGTHLVIDEDYMVTGGTITMIDKRVALESIELSATEITIKVGETNTLTVALTPENATIASTLWEAYDGEPGSVTVDQAGNVVGVTEGTAMVQVTVTDAFDNEKVAQCTVTITAAPSVPEWIDPDDTENVQKYNAWALAKGVNDPNDAIKEAFLFNVANDESAVELAKGNFKIHSITIDSEGTVTIEPPNEADVGVEFFNGTVILRGSATVDGEYLLPQADPDARFFKAFLELISSN